MFEFDNKSSTSGHGWGYVEFNKGDSIPNGLDKDQRVLAGCYLFREEFCPFLQLHLLSFNIYYSLLTNPEKERRYFIIN